MKLRTASIGLALLVATVLPQAQTSGKRPPPKKTTAATNPPAHNDKEIVAAIRELEESMRKAALAGDGSWWERHLDDNYVGVDPVGQANSKADAVRLHSSEDLKYDEVNFGDFTLRTYNGDTVVITGINTLAGSYKGQDFSGHYHFLQVWVKEADDWKLAVSQTDKTGP